MTASFASALFITLLYLGGGIIPFLWFSQPCRSRILFFFFMAIPLQILVAGVLASACYEVLPWGWGKSIFVYGGATVIVSVFLRAVAPYLEWKRDFLFPPRLMIGIGALTLLCCADLWFIFGKNGWGFDDGSLVTHTSTYFRAPLNSDNERNTILMNALIRGTDSPLLPYSKMSYQLFWFHLFAPLVSLYQGVTLYQVTQGIALANALIFFFLLWTAILWLRPSFILRKKEALLTVLLLSAHADLYYLLASYFEFGRAGIEADWSMVPSFFRNFSLKMLALTSPQHLMALLFALAYLVLPEIVLRPKKIVPILRGVFLIGGILVSPVMATMIFPLIWGSRLIHHWCRTRNFACRDLGYELIAVIAGLGIYQWLLGSPWELFQRPGVNRLVLFQSGWQILWRLPLTYLGALGSLGLLVTLLLADNLSKMGIKSLTAFYPVMLLAGGIFSHYLVTSLESRRHAAMVFSLIATIFVIKKLPPLRRIPTLAITLFTVITLGCHGYFIYCFTGKKSSVNPEITWIDYFTLGKWISTHTPKLPVLAATEPFESGVIFSPINQFTTSFAFGGHTIVHSKLSQQQIHKLIKIRTIEDVPPMAKRLGYRAIAWGPAEDMIWGDLLKNRFTHPSRLITTIGKVSLFSLGDNLEPELREKGLWKAPLLSKDRENWLLQRGEFFFTKNWPLEALENFEIAEWEFPKNPNAQFGLGKSQATYRRYDEALSHYLKAQALGLNTSELYYRKGTALAYLNHLDEAESDLRTSISQATHLWQAYSKLTKVLIAKGNLQQAQKIAKEATQIHPENPELRLALAQVEAHLGNYNEATYELEKILNNDITKPLRHETLMTLGKTHVARQDFLKAKEAFVEATTLSPNDVLSHRNLSDVWRAIGDEKNAIRHKLFADELEDREKIPQIIKHRSQNF